MLNNKIILPVLGALLGATVFGSQIYAQDSITNQTLIQKIAQKFGLKEDEVKVVFDEFISEKHKVMESRYENFLSGAVSEGKITELQKQALLAKHKEMLNNMENWKDFTPDQRKEAMTQRRQDLKNWAKENNIDLQYLYDHHGTFHNGMKHWFGR